MNSQTNMKNLLAHHLKVFMDDSGIIRFDGRLKIARPSYNYYGTPFAVIA